MKDKIKGTHNYLIALVKKAERKLYYEQSNDHTDFNAACEAGFEAEKELKDAQKELKDFEIKNNLTAVAVTPINTKTNDC